MKSWNEIDEDYTIFAEICKRKGLKIGGVINGLIHSYIKTEEAVLIE